MTKTDKFEFIESSHTYKLNGKRMTGITTIIGVLGKPQLIGWAAKMAVEYIATEMAALTEKGDIVLGIANNWARILKEAVNAHTRKKEEAGEHGTDTHALVEAWIKNRMDNRMSPTDFTPIQKFIDWALENVETFLFSERIMHDPKLFIAGTADFAYIGKDGRKYMADFKTSSGIYGLDYFLQVSAYRLLAEIEGDSLYDGMCIVRLGRKGDFEVQLLYEYETYRDAFLSCLALYRAQAALQEFIVKEK